MEEETNILLRTRTRGYSTEPEPEPEKKVVMMHEKVNDRTQVKARVQNIKKKSSGSPAKVPEWKQVKLAYYFGRKRPKPPKPEKQNLRQKLKKTRGPRAPFWENLVSLSPKKNHLRTRTNT